MLRNSFSKFLASNGGEKQPETEPDHDGTLQRLRSRGTEPPLYKKHDDFLQGASVVSEKFEDRAQRQNMSRWRLGKYTPPPKQEIDSRFASIDPLSSSTSNFALPKAAADLNPTECLMSSQLKEHILHRYVQTAEEQIARRESFDLFIQNEETTPIAEVEEEAMECITDEKHLAIAPILGYDEQQLKNETAISENESAGFGRIKSILAQNDDSLFSEDASLTEEPSLDAEPFPEFEQYSVERSAYDEMETDYEALKYKACEAVAAMIKEWEPPSTDESTGWKGLVERRRRLMEQAIAFSTTPTRQSMTETADFEPYVVPAGECLLPWGSEYLADERDASLSSHTEEVSSEDSALINLFHEEPIAEFVDELDYIRYIFSNYAELSVLQRMAKSAATPSFVLAQLAFHPDIDVRNAVAQNPHTPMEALWLLVMDETEEVRAMLASNESIPLEVLNVMSKDDSPYIAQIAQKTLTRVRSKVVTAPFGQSVIRKAASS